MRKISLIYGILALSVANIEANEFVDSGYHVVIPTKLVNLPADATHIMFAAWIEGGGPHHPNYAGRTGLGYTLVEPTDQDIIQDVEIPVHRYGDLFDGTSMRQPPTFPLITKPVTLVSKVQHLSKTLAMRDTRGSFWNWILLRTELQHKHKTEGAP